MPTVMERVRKVVVEELSVDEDQVVPDASFTDDLAADSLGLVQLIMALETEFGTDDDNPLEIPEEDAEKINTVQETVDYIKGRGVQDA